MNGSRPKVFASSGIAALMVILATTSPAGAQIRQSRLFSDNELARYGLTAHWFTHVVLDADRDHIANIAIADDRLFVQTSRGVLQALDAETGKREWMTPVGRPDRVSYPATTNSFGVFVVNGSYLYALDKRTGLMQWSHSILGSPAAGPTANERFVYVPAIDGRLYAFDIAERRMDWYFRAGARIEMPAVTALGRVAFASRNARMYVTPENERRVLFEYQTDEPVSAPLAQMGPWILLPSEDHNVYAVNIQNGRTRWRQPFGYPFNEAPTIIEGTVYVPLYRGGMYQIDLDTGEEEWFNPHASNFLSASPTRLYGADKSNRLVILNRADGNLLGAFDVTDFEHRLHNDRTDRIYLATNSGLLVCLRQRDLVYPTYLQAEDNQPLMPEFSTEVPNEALRP